MDRLDAMAAFVAVAEHRGFAHAARRLGLSPSAVTRLVAALEERLSIRLLQRTTRSVTLTDAGARYLERARRILAEVEEAEDAAQEERTVPKGRFVLTAPDLFGRLNVAPLMSTFLSRHPGVMGELLLSDRTVNLVEEGVDAAVRIGVLADSSLFARKVGETRRVVVASPEYLAQRKKPQLPGDVASHDVILFTGLNPTPEWRFSRDGRLSHVSFTPTFVTNSADAALAHTERGHGLTMLLAYQVAESVRAGRLKVVLSKFEPPPLPIHLVYPTSRLLSAKVRAFVDLAVSTCNWHFVNL
ncbi:LysR family transcriptional regulator [Pyxidicoccus trucidator]|uniref:LysR family transcriptional regulator n=1 Tax=Pyxidicoccus trucidator TaxID=2709662 RepID=UPI0013DB54C5|nr:LysR family transcriptional regulator [Pyxidicoccus trucidator]